MGVFTSCVAVFACTLHSLPTRASNFLMGISSTSPPRSPKSGVHVAHPYNIVSITSASKLGELRPEVEEGSGRVQEDVATRIPTRIGPLSLYLLCTAQDGLHGNSTRGIGKIQKKKGRWCKRIEFCGQRMAGQHPILVPRNLVRTAIVSHRGLLTTDITKEINRQIKKTRGKKSFCII